MKGVWVWVVGLLWAAQAGASTGASLSYGTYKHHEEAIRGAVQMDLPFTCLAHCAWRLAPYLEASVLFIHTAENHSAHPNQLIAVALSPVFRFIKQTPILTMYPFVEAGVGLAWVSEDHFGERSLGIPHQFEDRVGVGVRAQTVPLELAFRFTHFSNAHLAAENSGFNVYTVTLGYWTTE